jgi:hypothetical protein
MTIEHDDPSARVSRRAFLRRLGIGAAASGAPAVLRVGPARARTAARRPPTGREDRFGRLFPRLPSFAQPGPALEAALLELGRPGGLLDARDPLDRGPVDLIADLALSANNPDNPTHTAGVTFMGQFMDHDMTFDLSSRLAVPVDPRDAPNSRTPALDLDSLYGAGPAWERDLYEPSGGRALPTKFRVEHGGLFEDLPRAADGTALIADPRNDENLVIAGLHAAFLLFHNAVVDLVARRHPGAGADEVFRRARQLVTWHYQWMVVHEFLPLFIGPARTADILARRRPGIARADDGVIPVEFQGAAYRFGHSMVRPSYRANLAGDRGQAFFALVFDPTQEGVGDPGDLRGGARAPRRFVGWQTFFDFGDGQARPNKLIDTRISTPLFDLPVGAIAAGGGPTSLPQRNLLRHITWQLPSGQSIARALDEPVLSAGDLDELRAFDLGLEVSTPLWYYVLKEAEVMEGGLHLGPVGGRLVGEVIVGLLRADRESFLSGDPRWRPTLPARNGRVTGDFRMVDLLTLAGVDPTSRGQ